MTRSSYLAEMLDGGPPPPTPGPPRVTVGVVTTVESTAPAFLPATGPPAPVTETVAPAFIAAQPHYIAREVRVYDPADLTTEVAIIDAPVGADWLKARQDIGTGSITFYDNDPALAYMATKRVARVYIEGTPHFQWVLQNKNPKRIEEGEEAAQQTVWSGPGIASILNRGSVGPTLGYNRLPFSDQKVLSFASPEYVPTGWGSPTVIVPHWSSTSIYYTGLPTGFPNLSAPWIGPALGTQYAAPIGHWYLILDFTMPNDGLFTFFVAADNKAKVNIDGLRFIDIAPGGESTSGFAQTHQASMLLSGGAHRLAIDVTNIDLQPGLPDPGTGVGVIEGGNPTALICDGWYSGPNGQLVSRLFDSGSSGWLSQEYPDVAPGMTIGQMANILFDDANAQGALTYVNRTWTDTLDSNGDPWDVVYKSVGFTVGTGLVDILKSWHAKGYADFSMGRDSYDVNLYLPGGAGTDRSVVFEHFYNLTKLEESTQDVGVDTLMVRWNLGQFLYPSTGGESVQYLEVGKADTQDEATEIAAAVLAYEQAGGTGRSQLSATILPGRGAVPAVNFEVDDSVSVEGLSEDVVQIGGKFDDSKGVAFSVTFRDLILEWEERVIAAMKARINGTLNGDTVTATPAVAPSPFGSAVSTTDVQFQLQDNPDGTTPSTPTESPDKRPVASLNIYAVAVTAKTAGATDTTFEFRVDGIDILGGAGVLPAGSTYALIPIYGGGVVFVNGGLDVMCVYVTAIGGIDCGHPTGTTGLIWEPRFV